jgi:hypothetical protein
VTVQQFINRMTAIESTNKRMGALLEEHVEWRVRQGQLWENHQAEFSRLLDMLESNVEKSSRLRIPSTPSDISCVSFFVFEKEEKS